MDFIIGLPLCIMEISAVFTCIDRLTKYCRLVPCFVGQGALSASSVAKIFFDNVSKVLWCCCRGDFRQGTLGSLLPSGQNPQILQELWALLGI